MMNEGLSSMQYIDTARRQAEVFTIFCLEVIIREILMHGADLKFDGVCDTPRMKNKPFPLKLKLLRSNNFRDFDEERSFNTRSCI